MTKACSLQSKLAKSIFTNTPSPFLRLLQSSLTNQKMSIISKWGISVRSPRLTQIEFSGSLDNQPSQWRNGVGSGDPVMQAEF
jgi:hypothetical protein